MQYFFEPRSVVLVGVTRASGSGAYNNLEMMLSYGYQGRIYVVHPKVAEILGHRTYSRVGDLPEVPDLAVISVGRKDVLPVFAACVEHGIRNVVVISQGFADADERGRRLQTELQAMAQAGKVRVVGPNTLGIVNAFNGFSTSFIDIPRDPSPPPLSIVVQSGVFLGGLESFTGRLGKGIDIGNASDVDFVDVLEFLEHDPQTQIIVLHIEGMRRGREFLHTASRVARHKPVIVLKTGRSAAGARAATSHTGSMVGEDAVFDAAFARAGMIRVSNTIELRAVCQAFLHFRSMSGPKLAVVTASGALGIMTADACEDYGLELAPFPETIREALENSHIGWHHLSNPADIWPLGMASGSFTDVFKRTVCLLLADDRVDAVLGIAPMLHSPLHKDLDMAAVGLEISAANHWRKPVAFWLYGGDQARAAAALAETEHVACFGSIDEAIIGLSACRRYYQRLQKKPDSGAERYPQEAEGARPTAPSLAEGVHVGKAAFELLRHYHIPTAPEDLTSDAAGAVVAAGKMGYPVVLKIISSQWLHKSDRGGIRLNISNDRELRQAYAELTGLFLSHTPDGRLDGILVQQQIQGTELLMGIKRDPQFGPILVLGMGGIYTEIFRDTARSLLPVQLQDVEEMFRSLRIYPILEGTRGQAGVCWPVLSETALALGRLAMEHPEVAELDLNPVLANADGCWCVDCRIIVHGAD
ncbi:MAG: acetate--CoA ligase family protein [Syntrophobacteraceae bacterium]